MQKSTDETKQRRSVTPYLDETGNDDDDRVGQQRSLDLPTDDLAV